MLQTLVIVNANCPPTDFKSSSWYSASLVTQQHAVRHLWNEQALHKFSSDVGKKISLARQGTRSKGNHLPSESDMG